MWCCLSLTPLSSQQHQFLNLMNSQFCLNFSFASWNCRLFLVGRILSSHNYKVRCDEVMHLKYNIHGFNLIFGKKKSFLSRHGTKCCRNNIIPLSRPHWVSSDQWYKKPTIFNPKLYMYVCVYKFSNYYLPFNPSSDLCEACKLPPFLNGKSKF